MTRPLSDHFNGKTFFYPGEAPHAGLLDLIKWKATSKAVPWPEKVDLEPIPLPPPPDGDGVAATWIGQSTFLLRTSGLTILTDPIFSDRASPFSWLGPTRAIPPAIALVDLPRVDLVLLSHDHYDHCDLPTLRSLARRDNPVVVTPLGFERLLKGAGVGNIVELDWWQSGTPVPGAEVTLVPARHWCRRRPFATNVRLWGGFMLKAGGRLVYFVGDSGYDEVLFKEIGRRCGPPDLALIPIGAYEPRWFMSSAHMNPAESIRVHRDVGAKRSLAMHWGTFDLTDEGREEPVRDLEAARSAADDFQAIDPGASVLV
jgi:L-ascorbate metabolism protein UlaG (beta-lactamase superfamily)